MVKIGNSGVNLTISIKIENFRINSTLWFKFERKFRSKFGSFWKSTPGFRSNIYTFYSYASNGHLHHSTHHLSDLHHSTQHLGQPHYSNSHLGHVKSDQSFANHSLNSHPLLHGHHHNYNTGYQMVEMYERWVCTILNFF